jgi:ABC-type glycerol-3-phosphate transport system substrate-binding protein
MPDKVKSAISFGQPPDVVHQHAFVLGAQGYAEPLDDLWKEWGARSKFLPSALEDTLWNGVSYGVPLDINCTFLIFNKKMFTEAGLALPTDTYTYTQLLEDAKKLTKADGSRYGVAFNNGVWNMFGHIRSNGGKLLDETGATAKTELDDPANLEMLQFIANAINVDKVAPKLPITKTGFDPVDMFDQGKVAMFFSGPWDLQQIHDKGPAGLYDQIGTTTMPHGLHGQTSGSVQGGGSLFVPKGSKHRRAAFEFMKWSTSDKYQLRLAKEMGRYPVVSNLYQDPYFTTQPLLQPFFQQLNTSQPYKLEAYQEAELSWEHVIFETLSGNTNPNFTLTVQQANQVAQQALNLASQRK